MSRIGNITSEMRGRSRHDFERVVFELINPLVAGVVHARPTGEADRLGIDLYTLSEDDPGQFALAVQCKGFELEFGPDQVAQCLASIVAFRNSGRRAGRYAMVVNREPPGGADSVNRAMIKPLSDALAALVTDGLADEAQLFTPKHFAEQFMVPAADDVLGSATLAHGEAWIREYRESMDWRFYLPGAPFRLSEGGALGAPGARDPLGWLASRVRSAVSAGLEGDRGKGVAGSRALVVSEFGFGKTSLMMELFRELRGMISPIFLPVASFPRTAFANSQSFADAVVATLLDEAAYPRLVWDLLGEAMTYRMRRAVNSVLLLDGLDEHPLLYEARGPLQVFRCLADVCGACVISVRRELFHDRAGDFQAALLARSGTHRVARGAAAVVELDDWDTEILCRYVDASETSVPECPASADWRRFADHIRAGDYERHYGDIPRRPLFLRMLADDAIDGTLTTTALVDVYERYFLRKFDRDRDVVAAIADAGRPLRAPEADRLEHARRLMSVHEAVAAATIDVDPGTQMATMQTEFAEQLAADALQAAGLEGVPLVDLLNHGVLVPTRQRALLGMTLRFAHRSFQAWFCARVLTRAGHPATGVPGIRTSDADLARFLS